MDPNQQIKAEKRPYVKPRLRVIKLVGGEVLGIGCKTWETGPSEAIMVGGVPSFGCGLATPCYQEAS